MMMTSRLDGLFNYLNLLTELARTQQHKVNQEIKAVTEEINKELGISVVIGNGKG